MEYKIEIIHIFWVIKKERLEKHLFDSYSQSLFFLIYIIYVPQKSKQKWKVLKIGVKMALCEVGVT